MSLTSTSTASTPSSIALLSERRVFSGSRPAAPLWPTTAGLDLYSEKPMLGTDSA